MKIDELRDKIDALDLEILRLLNERYKAVIEIGKLKKAGTEPVYVPERERAVFKRLHSLNEGPMRNATLQAIYCEIMSGALALESPFCIVCSGTENGPARQAAASKFGSSVEYRSEKNLPTLFDEVASGRADFGCIPADAASELNARNDLAVCTEIGSGTAPRFLIIGRKNARE